MYYNTKECGENIKKLRKKQGLSQAELSKKIGIHTKTISKAERGVNGLSVDNLIIIAEFFGVTLDYLVKGKTDNTCTDMTSIVDKMNDVQKGAFMAIMDEIKKCFS